MHLETGRLILWPLTTDQLIQCIKNPDAAVNRIGLGIARRDFREKMQRRRIYRAKLYNCRLHSENWLLCTSWLIVERRIRVVIGESGFKGEPMEGAIEIGYCIYRDHRGQKYAQEAIGALCAWGLGCPDVSYILAETLPDNYPSQGVLKKCGFIFLGRRGKYYDWQLPRSSLETARAACINAGQII